MKNSAPGGPLRLPNNRPNIPQYPSQPAGLPGAGPALPTSPASQTGSSSGGGNQHSSSRNHSGGSGFPFAPLVLGLCGHLPASSKRTISKMISEVSRRLKNGIGVILAPRAPTIMQVAESSLAFVHQVNRGNQPTFILTHFRLNPFSTMGLFVSTEGSYSYRLTRSQDNCGLFYLVRKDGR